MSYFYRVTQVRSWPWQEPMKIIECGITNDFGSVLRRLGGKRGRYFDRIELDEHGQPIHNCGC